MRLIMASISASYHIFNAAEAPAPTEMRAKAAIAKTGCKPFSPNPPGAIIMPTKAVKTTSDITRGFIKAI